MSLESRGPKAPERKDMKEGKEAPGVVDIRVIGNDGKLSEPRKAEVVGMSMSKVTGRPELKYKLVDGAYGSTYTAEWQNYGGVEGWTAYPMD